MLPSLTWEEVLARTDLIGGDLESRELDGHVYRGPIQKIHNEKMSVVFQLEWTARRGLKAGEWDAWKNRLFSVNKTLVIPRDMRNGRIFLDIPFLGIATIFPRGGDKLYPAQVKGLAI